MCSVVQTLLGVEWQRQAENATSFRRRGWKWFVYIYFPWNFPNSHQHEAQSRERKAEASCARKFSYHQNRTFPKNEVESRFSRAMYLARLLSMRHFTFYYDERWFYSNENSDFLLRKEDCFVNAEFERKRVGCMIHSRKFFFNRSKLERRRVICSNSFLLTFQC